MLAKTLKTSLNRTGSESSETCIHLVEMLHWHLSTKSQRVWTRLENCTGDFVLSLLVLEGLLLQSNIILTSNHPFSFSLFEDCKLRVIHPEKD